MLKVVRGVGCGGLRLSFELSSKGKGLPRLSKCETGEKGGGFKVWIFCDNVITECPQGIIYLSISSFLLLVNGSAEFQE